MMASVRLYLELGAAAVLLIGFMLFVHHERQVGERNLQHSVAAATAQAKRQAVEQTAVLQAKSDLSERNAADAQSKLDDYINRSPVEPVRLCVNTASRPIVPKAGAASSSATATSAGPDLIQPVPASAPGPDISRGLSAIVSAAGAMAIDLGEFQAR